MRVSLFDQWGALNSTPVWESLRAGFAALGIECASHDHTADVAVIWSVVWAGRMKNNRRVWQEFRNSGRPVIVAEVGMLHRGRTWKLGLNGTGIDNYNFDQLDQLRPEKLNIGVRDWRTAGRDIVIALQRSDSEQWAGLPDTKDWLPSVIADIKQHTDRPIIVRPHPRQRVPDGNYTVALPNKIAGSYDSFDFGKSLKNAWAVINWNSGTGVQSILHGVPAFVGPNSLAAPVATLDWTQIENPQRPDRSLWVKQLCHTEWLLKEIATGAPIQRLLELQAF